MLQHVLQWALDDWHCRWIYKLAQPGCYADTALKSKEKDIIFRIFSESRSYPDQIFTYDILQMCDESCPSPDCIIHGVIVWNIYLGTWQFESARWWRRSPLFCISYSFMQNSIIILIEIDFLKDKVKFYIWLDKVVHLKAIRRCTYKDYRGWWMPEATKWYLIRNLYIDH